MFSGAGVLTVYTVDLDKGLPAVDADAIFTSADTVYASPSSLYVATQRWDAEARDTSIHRFDISDPDRTSYAASGVVPGHAAQPVLAVGGQGRAARGQHGRLRARRPRAR